MLKDLLDLMRCFFAKYYDAKRPVLVGFSGGPDSLLLTHLLLNMRTYYPTLEIHLLHVDHSWVKADKKVAAWAQAYARSLGLPFYLKRLGQPTKKANLEELGRKARLVVFKELVDKYGFQAVFLGHHGDDWAETVLKRVLEGASLANLGGLKEVTQIKGINFWRPFLHLSKQAILKALEEMGANAIGDVTNKDLHFLRNRMRRLIIPELSKHFGKEVREPLCHLGLESQELKEYLGRQIEPLKLRIVTGPYGSYLNLKEEMPREKVELDFLLRSFLEQQEACPSRKVLSTIAQLLVSGKSNKKVVFGKSECFIDRKCVFFLATGLVFPLRDKKLREGLNNYGAWRIRVTRLRSKESAGIDVLGWEKAWQGKLTICLPLEEYKIGLPRGGESYYAHSKLAKFWSDNKIPLCLRDKVPVLWCKGKIVHEFLSGHKKLQCSAAKEKLLITLEEVSRPA